MRILVTGGAGFIGSNLVDALLARGDTVRVLDDLSTGHAENLPADVELVVGSVADAECVAGAMDGIEAVFHEGARGSVARSVEDPLTTDTMNTHGTLTVLHCAQRAGVRRVIYASSSSVYGGATEPPTPETAPLVPRSPYAVSKLAGEVYCRVFAELHGLETVSLRYFNVFGPRQRPDSQYAAVIPLFIDALRNGRPVEVHGDGLQSRDFTYVSDVVAGNLAVLDAPAAAVSGRVFNLAPGTTQSLLDLLGHLEGILGVSAERIHTDPRAGDVRLSQADGRLLTGAVGFQCEVPFDEGLRRTVEWFAAR
ncbi:MAG: SDR family oxidoreductase [Actinomycetes bacterium]